MSDIAIKVENLSKVYKLYDKPIDRMKESLHPLRKRYHRDFYALNDVSFEIKKGETIGIIGKNGSGKSTLLKILTGVLTPTSGKVEVNGRVSALLELGAGFNPEFTGLENVYFNGSIMGYPREEMDSKIDDILSFADIGDFINQPVKMYSSGMFARLAFAVSVNVDPEILIVDEALSVGDAMFVKKCFEKMEEFKKKGITIIIVSHDVNTIKMMADKSIIMDSGVRHYFGDSDEAVLKYFQLLFPKKSASKSDLTNANCDLLKDSVVDDSVYSLQCESSASKDWGIGGGKIVKIDIMGLKEKKCFNGGDLIRFEIECIWDIQFINNIIKEKLLEPNIIVGIVFENKKNIMISGCNTFESGIYIDPRNKSNINIVFEVKMPDLAPEEYFVSPAIAIGTQLHHQVLNWSNVVAELRSLPKRKYYFGIQYFDAKISIKEIF